MASKILLTLGTLIYCIAPLFADLNASHVHHPEWTPHARLHMVWLLSVSFSIGALALYQIWVKGNELLAGTLGLIILGGFWVAALTKDSYGGALADEGGIERLIMGLNGNAFGFGVATVLIVAGLLLRFRK